MTIKRISLLLIFLAALGVMLWPEESQRYSNLYPTIGKKSRGDFWRWRLSRWKNKRPGPESYHFQLASNEPKRLQHNETATSVTWIGHATVLLQIAGVNILTDPQFSERASPVQWAGPKRAIVPGLALLDLPPIHAVLLSHNHYDSLDVNTVRALRQRPGGEATQFFVPQGLRDWFKKQGVENVQELAWWQNATCRGLTVTAVPAQHWSKRTFWDTNRSHWAGFVVQGPRLRFYFAGDSAYQAHFAEIGKRLGPFDLAAIPIGAYEPRWFMKKSHINPEEAVQAHLDLKAKLSLAIHWGTFVLTDEPLDQPPKDLAQALTAKNLPLEVFRVLQHGETLWL